MPIGLSRCRVFVITVSGKIPTFCMCKIKINYIFNHLSRIYTITSAGGQPQTATRKTTCNQSYEKGSCTFLRQKFKSIEIGFLITLAFHIFQSSVTSIELVTI